MQNILKRLLGFPSRPQRSRYVRPKPKPKLVDPWDYKCVLLVGDSADKHAEWVNQVVMCLKKYKIGVGFIGVGKDSTFLERKSPFRVVHKPKVMRRLLESKKYDMIVSLGWDKNDLHYLECLPLNDIKTWEIDNPQDLTKIEQDMDQIPEFQKTLFIKGKVRNVYELDPETLAIFYSDRFSCFDQVVCKIPLKGCILNRVCTWWFEKTRHIIPNHLIYSDPATNGMIVEKCKRINIEVVVRGYITGSTNTSLWTQYSQGVRKYCGITFPDGLEKNQKLPKIIVTPTTKSTEHDKPISPDDIVEMGLATQNEWDFISKKAIELYEFGAKIANKKGLILVDTKYEFGKNAKGEILLIDEVHTLDSSRYWLLETFEQRQKSGMEPERFDKDIIREWVKKVCNPYDQKVPSIPPYLIQKVHKAYRQFTSMLLEKEEMIDYYQLAKDLQKITFIEKWVEKMKND